MSDTIRIAVCQLECHPAIIVGDRDYRKEPFLPLKAQPSLADLSRHSLDVTTLQASCSHEYDDWHSRRLQFIVDWLATLDPVPDIVVFPECSIPIHDLYTMKAFASKHNAAVFAGTHTLRLTQDDVHHYDALEIPKKSRKEWSAYAGMTILPVFCGDSALAHVKEMPSVFEQTDISPRTSNLHVLSPLGLTIRGRTLRVLTAVCAEALRLNAPATEYDLVVLVAYNDGHEPFLPTIKQNTQNQVPVVFCNDGRFGGSSINVVSDHRMNGIWWWSAPVNGILPAGDSILVADVHLDCLAAQFGVANPSPPARLVALASIVASSGKGSAAAGEIRSIAMKGDNMIQASLLDGCLQQLPLTHLQHLSALHLRRLAQAGTATPEWWRVLGDCCLLPGLGDLRQLEALLADKCARTADAIIANSVIDDDALLGKVTRFKRSCLEAAKRSGTDQSVTNSEQRRTTDTPLDRDDEAREIRDFLDHAQQRVLFVSGLDDVGKETVVALALAQAGRRHVWIELAPDATLQFLLQSLARHFQLKETGVATLEGIADIADSELIDRVPLGTVIIITHAESLRDHGQWRDPATPTWLTRFARALEKRQGKLLVVSTIRVELDELEPRQVRRLPVRGLPEEHALVLFDQQLRRAGLEPTHYDNGARREIVREVGCHPGAIILASEYVEQDGFQSVAADLHKRGQVHTQIVRRILKRLRFTEEEQAVLSLLGEARIPLPASVLNKAGVKNALPAAQSLLHHSVLERHQEDHIALTDLVRGFADFTQVSQRTVVLFHKAAAEELARLAGSVNSPDELSWAVESRYHAQLAGDLNLAPNVPYLVDGVVGAVQRLVEVHDYEAARPIIDRLLKTDKTAELFQLGAIIYARLGKCEESLALVKEALAIDKNRTWAVTEVGNLSLHVRRADIAQECVELVKRTGHDSPYLATLEGKILLKQDGEAAAVHAFRRAVQLSEAEPQPYDAWPHFYLGRTLLKANKAEEAIDVLYRGEIILSNRRRPHRSLLIAIRTQLAIGYMYSGDLTSAKRIFDLITADDAGRPEVVWAFALYRAASGDGGNSGDLATDTLRELDPNAAKDRYDRCQVYLFRALIYLGLGNQERASEEFSRAHQEDPRNVFVLLRWAQTLIELAQHSDTDGEHQAARICAEHAKSLADKVIEFDRDNNDARTLLERLSDEFNVV